MNFQSVKKLQKDYGFTAIQEQINNGSVWSMEGSMGRYAMSLLESGVCMLPKKRTTDYYGNVLPSRDDVKAGTKGSFKNSVRYWQGVENGEWEPFEEY